MKHRRIKRFHVLILPVAIFSLALSASLPGARAFGSAPGSNQVTGAFPPVNDLPVRKEMPDVMTMDDGTRVKTIEQWRQRRTEMKAILEHYELGHAPPPPGNVTGQDLKSSVLLDGTVKYRLVHLKFGPDEELGFDIAIFTPAQDGPFPTIINPSFFNTPGVAITNTGELPTASEAATNLHARLRLIFNSPVTQERGAESFTNELNRGYAVVTYHYTECGADAADFRKSSYYPAYPGYDWGVLLGWAWGLSRVMDYVETQPFADTNKIIALGHSRLGKLVMVATAFDERISLGAPAGSSGAGTGAYGFCGPGRGGKEGIETMTRKFPYYFVPRLRNSPGRCINCRLKHIGTLPWLRRALGFRWKARMTRTASRMRLSNPFLPHGPFTRFWASARIAWPSVISPTGTC